MSFLKEFASNDTFIVINQIHWTFSSVSLFLSILSFLKKIIDQRNKSKLKNQLHSSKTPRFILYLIALSLASIINFVTYFTHQIIFINEMRKQQFNYYDSVGFTMIFSLSLILQIINTIPILNQSYNVHGLHLLSHLSILLLIVFIFSEKISNNQLSEQSNLKKLQAFLILTALISATSQLFILLFIPCRFVADRKKLIWPERKVNLFSRLNFIWLFPPLYTAWMHGVSIGNTLKLDELNNPPYLSRHIRRRWQKDRYHGQSSTSLLKYIFMIFWKQFIFLIILRLLTVLSSFLFPILSELFAIYYDDPNFRKSSWQNITLIISLIFAFILESCFNNQFFYYSYFLTKELQSGITELIYQKMMRITTANKNQDEIIEKMLNFVSNEFSSVLTFVVYFAMLVVMPFELGTFIYLLYVYVKYSIFIGLGCLISIFILTSFAIRRSKVYISKQIVEQDKRIKAVSNLLNGFKIIKLYSWEDHFELLIKKFRDQEVRYFRLESIFNIIMTNLWNFSSAALMISTYVSYIFVVRRSVDARDRIETEKTVAVLYLLNMIRQPISLMPMIISSLIATKNSMQRLHEYLSLKEKSDNNWLLKRTLDSEAEKGHVKNEYPIEIKESKYIYNSQKDFILHLNEMKIESGNLIGISGTVGSGKSSFIAAICGNMIRFDEESVNGDDKNKISIKIDNSIAYVSQEAWLQSRSIKQNILFFKDYDKEKYDRVIEACSLYDDFIKLPAGDMTIIGERGMNLSGGQKQRISLARAAYANELIYLLDDPQSAVDVHVGKHIFEKLISNRGLLRNTTRLLICNNPEYLRQCDKIIVFVEGSITDFDTYDKVSSRYDFLENFTTQMSLNNSNVDGSFDEESRSKIKLNRLTMPDSIIEESGIVGDIEPESQIESFFTGERVEMDTTRFTDIAKYFKKYGTSILFICFASFLVSVTFNIIGDYYLYFFMKKSNEIDGTNGQNLTSLKYFWFYVAFTLTFIVTSAIFYSFMAYGGHQSSALIHNKVLKNLLHWPISQFEKTPSGRIINRFSKDLYTIDYHIPRNLQYIMLTFVGILVSYMQVIILDQMMIIFILICIFFTFLSQRIYIGASRQYRRLELVSRSPILSHLVETYRGNHIISIMGVEKFMMDRFQNSLAEQIRWTNLQALSYRWIAIVLDYSIGFLLVAYLASINIGKSKKNQGTAIAYTIGNIKRIAAITVWLVRIFGDFELNSISMQRLAELMKLAQEPQWIINGPILDSKNQIVEVWPSSGEIEFENLSFSYRPNLPPALNNINLIIAGGSKVGVVGRTGAGKSTLISALFRTQEPSAGRILIDGVDITSLGLHKLRKSLTLIPQDPVIFETSLRDNLDPEHLQTNDDIMKYLEMANLLNAFGTIHQTPDDLLATQLHEDSLSLGQKQLLCLVRALLRRSKILLLDEATASVDQQTDLTIQTAIKTQFKHTTIVTIAHRLQTIIDYDRILVMSGGIVAEWGTPQELIDRRGQFFEMCEASNLLQHFRV